ncbi:VCBS repeat-containing protein [Candidatus Dependentiae bacterium]|nr:VCBS repeat-containing protein [Candidatus Dependentiae bacterium]
MGVSFKIFNLIFLWVILLFSSVLNADDAIIYKKNFAVSAKKIAPLQLEKMKNIYGVYDSSKNYNKIINGYGTGLRPPTEEEWNLIENNVSQISSVQFAPQYAAPLPAAYDNSNEIWFPPIGNQGGEGSCTFWASVYYSKTFQEAKEHNWNIAGAGENGEYKGSFTAEYADKIFSPEFSYNLLNKNIDAGGMFWFVNRTLYGIGAATFKTMPYNDYDLTAWPPEIAWREAALYRNETDNLIVNTAEDINFTNIKTLLNANIIAQIGVDASKYEQLSDSDLWTLDNYLAPIEYNHANTVIGYDDNFGPYTEEGEVRYGAFKIANSWGKGWPGDFNNDGCYWISYNSFRQFVPDVMYFIDKNNYNPQLLASFKISHSARQECDITIGVGDPSNPVKTKVLTDYIYGGSAPMPDNRIVIDITEFKNDIENNTFFLKVFDKDITENTGIIRNFEIEFFNSYSIYKNADTIYTCLQTPVNTINDSSVFLLINPAPAQNNDTAPPIAPVWTNADTSIFDTIKLYWTKPTLNANGEPILNGDTYLVGYKIFRSDSITPSDWTSQIIAEINSVDDTFYIDNTVNENQTYYYRIKAVSYKYSQNQKFIVESDFSSIFAAASRLKPYSLLSEIDLPGLSGLYRSEMDLGDYNNDGLIDIAITGLSAQNHFKIFRNTGDTFILAAEPMGAGKGLMRGKVKWLDYDNDGNLDLIANGNDGVNFRLILYKNINGEFIKTNEPMGENKGLQRGYIETADFDNDGDLDIIVSGNDGLHNRLIILWNDKGNFIRYSEPLGINQGLTEYSRIAVADYNKDGYIDFAAAGYDGSNYRFIIFKNNADDSFIIDQQPTGVNIGLDLPALVFGDYDNDGDMDLAAAGFDGENNRFIIFKNTNGIFANAVEPMGINQGFNIGSIKFGDYDSDGDIDITLQGYPAAFSIYENIGADSFIKKIEPLGLNKGGSIGAVDFADYNNDGLIDLFVTGSGLPTGVFKNQLTNINARPTAPAQVYPKCDSIEQGDTIIFQWNSGTDNITPVNALTYNLRIGKISGGCEIMSADTNSNHINNSNLYGNVQNNTSYIIKTQQFDAGTYYWSVQTIDNGMMKSVWSIEDTFIIALPADADTIAPAPPVIVSADTSLPGQIYLIWTKPLLNSNGIALINTDTDLYGYKIYRADTLFPANWNNCLIAIISDKDDTDYIDLTVTGGNTYYYRITAFDSSVRKNNSFNNESEFSDIMTLRSLVFPTQYFNSSDLIDLSSNFLELTDRNFALGDYDNDGNLDAALIGNDGFYNRFIIYKNEGNQFINVAEPLGSRHGFGENGMLNWSDYDNDGDLDLIASGFDGEARFMVFKNENNQFVKAYSVLGADIGFIGGDIKTADYDNDGDLDLAVTGDKYANNSLMVFQNINEIYQQKFEPMSANYGTENGELEWFDYDNDSDLDLLVSGKDDYYKRLILFRNDKTGFTKVAEPMGINSGMHYSSIAFADIDNDGDLDFAVAGNDGVNRRLIIFENQNGTFVNKQEPLDVNSGVSNGQIKFADYDDDGFIDLAVTGNDGSNKRIILFKNYNGTFVKDCEPAGTNAGFDNSKIFWNDWDKDGDLDLMVFGNNSNAEQKFYVYLNQTDNKNIRPVAPAIVSPLGTNFISGDTIIFRWNPVATDTTPQNAMTYNLRIGRKSGGSEIMSSDSVSAHTMNATLLGSVQNHTQWYIIPNSEKRLSNGIYYWSVQAVDAGLMKSEWAAEKMFTIADTIYIINSAETQIMISGKLTDDSPVSVLTIANTEALNIQFNIGDTATNIITNLVMKINPEKINAALTIEKADKNKYNTGIDLIHNYNQFSNTIIDLVLTDAFGNIISADSSAFEILPRLSYTIDKAFYSAEDLRKLRVMTFDEITNRWISAGEPVVSVNDTDAVISVSLNHFSIYGLFFAPSLVFANNLSNVIVYPNPFVPNDNDLLNGTPVSGISFANLPADAQIEIYTIAGGKVFSQTVNTSPFKWNVKNNDGRDVASGVYLYLIKSSSGKKTGKLAVIK